MFSRKLFLVTFFILFSGEIFAEQILTFSVRGRVQLLISNGVEFIGVNPDTNVSVSSLPNASYGARASGAEISIMDPVGGNYEVTVFGSYDEVITLAASFIDTELGVIKSTSAFTINEGMPLSFGLVLSTTEPHYVHFIPPVQPVVSIVVLDNAGNTQLDWNDSLDASVVSYAVYSKLPAESVFSQLGDSTSSDYLTSQPVMVPERLYVVLAENAQGEKSFFYDSVINARSLAPVFSPDISSGPSPLTVSFANSSVGAFVNWEWDFDSDGTVDSTDENPIYTYSSTGVYSVTLTAFTSDDSASIKATNLIVVDDDEDNDGIVDVLDNCIQIANLSQLDTDSDGYGNACDGDLNNDLFVNSLDLGLFKQSFFSSGVLDADLNGDGIVNALDTGLFKTMLFKVPGPSAVTP